MPFQFTGEHPTFGSTSDAFKPFAPAAPPSNPTTGPQSSSTNPLAFGTTSFLSNARSPDATPLSLTGPIASQSLTKVITNDSPKGEASTDSTYNCGPLRKAISRAKLHRLATFGEKDIAADHIIRGYLESVQGNGGDVNSYLGKLANEFDGLSETHPEIDRLLNRVLCYAPRSVDTVLEASRYEAPELEDDDTDTAPHVHRDIEKDSSLYNAIQTAIKGGIQERKHYQFSYTKLGENLAKFIWREKTREEGARLLLTYGWGQGTPGRGQGTFEQAHAEAEDFASWIFEEVWKIKNEFRSGWKVEGREDASYFGSGGAGGSQIIHTSAKSEQPFTGVHTSYMPERLETCCEHVLRRGFPHERPIEPPKTSFRFLYLPPEIRNLVYRHCLAPGSVSLESCVHHLPHGVSPVLTPGILATCKQIQKETEDLVFENTFIANTLLDSRATRREALHRLQFPPHILPKITSLMLLIDASLYKAPNCDWAPLQGLVSLKTLRIAGIESHLAVSEEAWAQVLEDVVTRVPADCQVEFGCASRKEFEHVRRMMGRIAEAKLSLATDGRVERVKETDARVLRAAAMRVPEDTVPGSLSGKASHRIAVGQLRGLPSQL